MIELIATMIEGGINSLIDYLSFHVMLCLVPAFIIAGAMVIFIPKEVVMKYIGKDSPKIIAYPVAAMAGFLLAVCSCTVLPLFAGIWKKGAGLGAAITFLFSAPAVNLLALTYTSTLIGLDIAIARAVLALSFAMLIGLIMDLLFGSTTNSNNLSEQGTEQHISINFNISKEIMFNSLVILSIVFSGLLLALLNHDMLVTIGINDTALVQTMIWLIGLSLLIYITFNNQLNRIASLFLWLVYILFTGTSQISYFQTTIETGINDIILSTEMLNTSVKTILTLIVSCGAIWHSKKYFNSEEIKTWSHETFFFVKTIFPYIIIGVFVAGMIDVIIPEEIFQDVVGQNTVLANLIGVLFGVFMYFPTLMEVPIAKIFLENGMARGVLLAYLLADPELSIQSILVTRKFLGDKINMTYVVLVIVFTVMAGLIFGLLVSQEPIGLW